jgi:hypothetical protein
LQKYAFCDLCALKLILGASPQTRLRGIEGGFYGAPAKTTLNNPLEGTQDHAHAKANPVESNVLLQMA